MAPEILPEDVRRFIVEHVDSVPHLEALLLLRETARPWTAQELASRVYLPPDHTTRLLEDLATKGWLVALAGAFEFHLGNPDAEMIARVSDHYRDHLVDVAGLIHRKAPPAVLDFARAFQLRKDR